MSIAEATGTDWAAAAYSPASLTKRRHLDESNSCTIVPEDFDLESDGWNWTSHMNDA
jgi:hypothetical protein